MTDWESFESAHEKARRPENIVDTLREERRVLLMRNQELTEHNERLRADSLELERVRMRLDKFASESPWWVHVAIIDILNDMDAEGDE